MEQENFESAMQDHKQALELLSTILQVCVHHSAPVFMINEKIGIYYYERLHVLAVVYACNVILATHWCVCT